jgi:hypothetical protein
MIRRLYAVIVLLIAVGAHAQVHPDVVEVELIGPGCEEVRDKIDLVVNGDEQRKTFSISRLRGAPCLWGGRIRWSIDRSDFFSLRLHGARTPIRGVVDFKNNETVAWLQFPYAPARTADVAVEFHNAKDEWLPLGYVRNVRKGGPEDLRFPESGELTLWTTHKVPDVYFDGEDLRLRWAPMKSNDPGLRVNSILTKKKKHAAFDAKHLVDELQRQGKGGDRRSPPSDSYPSREADRQMVHASNVKQLELAVP